MLGPGVAGRGAAGPPGGGGAPALEVRADSDAELTRGLLRLLAAELSGRSPGEVLGLGQGWLEGLGVAGALLGPQGGRGGRLPGAQSAGVRSGGLGGPR